MTIRDIKVFISLYREKSVTQTARSLGISQPAVSKAIRDIEKEYDIHLFDRMNRRLVPAETAAKFYSYALQALESFERAESEIKNGNQGPIRIGATATIGSTLLPHVIRSFHEIHPNITVNVISQSSARLLELLEDNRLDFALTESYMDGSNLILTELYTDRLIPIFSNDCPLKDCKKIPFSELAKYPLLGREEGSVTRDMINRILYTHAISASPLLESNSTHTILQFVREGLGVALIPERIARPYIEAGMVLTAEVIDQSFNRKYYLAVHKDKYLSPVCREFISLCREQVGESKSS